MGGKLLSLPEAARLVRDGQSLALGGNTLSRAPNAFARELARQGRRGLTLVKTAGAYDIDLLCAAGCAARVEAGYVGFENLFGLAPNYRRAVEEGRVEVREQACYTVIAALRASAFGLSSMPVVGLAGSDLAEAAGLKKVADPYSGEEMFMVPRIRPHWAILHVQAADPEGDARIEGSPFEDVLMSRAAEGVILTAERVVSREELARRSELVPIPSFLVRAVVPAPGGARPGSCAPLYDLDEGAIGRYLERAAREGGLEEHLSEWEGADRAAP